MSILSKKLTLIVLAVMLTTVAVILLARSPQPSYQGQSVSEWFHLPADHNWVYDRELDSQAFRAMGSEAVPFLVDRMQRAPSKTRERLLEKVSSGLSLSYRQNSERWQSRAAYLLGEIGSAAESAVPDLRAATNSSNWALRGAATVALMKVGGEPIEPLIEKLKDTRDYSAWYQNAMMVGRFGSRAESAVPILLDALKHTNNIIQAHALIALGMIAQQPDQCVPAIVPFLTSPNVSDRQKAIGALLGFGTNAITAKAEIRSALGDSDPWVRSRAAHAMEQLEGMEELQADLKTVEPAAAPELRPELRAGAPPAAPVLESSETMTTKPESDTPADGDGR